MWKAHVLPLPRNIASLSKASQEAFMRVLESTDKSRIFQVLKPEELKQQVIKNMAEFDKTFTPGKIHYLFKTIDYCGKAILVVVYVFALRKSCL